MKKIFGLLMAMMLFFAVVSCGANKLGESELKKLAEEEIYPDYPGSLAVIYDSMEQLEQDASLAVHVEIQGQEAVPLDGLPRTHSRAKIKAVLKGDPAVGEEITVVEEGDGEEFYMAVPPMNASREYILYLTEYEGKYYPCGAFQGKFVIKEGYVFQQGAGDTYIKEYTPVAVEEFVEKYSME